jgi:hypothetical protein
MNNFRVYLVALSCAFAISCASTSKVTPADDAEYKKLVNSRTKSTDQYDGMYQTFQATATLLTTEVVTAIVNRRATYRQWDAVKLQQERDRAFQELSATTRVMLRFFAPESDNDDLAKPKSIWSIYLEVGGKRYEGRARKSSDKLVELVEYFPYFDRFSSPYEITFNLPTSAVEGTSSKFIITSALGSAEFLFQNN